ncbi:hypothetical protein Cantr_02090 [Candida viswanathii]|uniref:HMG box domain-containing protein n=1 Tax=Candida viswanathii TaxID=5486 RepID=A0A367YK28_9ASCO|nr:hypothetical protein Cantr_02090 [Candida viswanathii]
MLRSFAIPVRSIAAVRASPLAQLRYLTTTSVVSEPTKSTKKQRVLLKSITEKLQKEKRKEKELKQQIKEREKELKARAGQRKLEDKAMRGHHSLSLQTFVRKVRKLPIVGIDPLKGLLEHEKQELEAACKKYNEDCRAFFSPRPEPKLLGYMLYVKAKFPEFRESGVPVKDVVKKVAASWRSLSDSEKEQYKGESSENDSNNAKKEYDEWKNKRVEEYKKYLKFRDSFQLPE